MPTVRSTSSIENLTKQIIKKNGNEEITAEKDQALRLDVNVSFLNKVDGGLVIQQEAGYAPSTPEPTSPTAFATVEMIKGSEANPITEQIWITAEPNPDDGLYHKIKVTMGTDGEFQKEDLGAI